jgi:membrane fusion protein (multidrug efflux system)
VAFAGKVTSISPKVDAATRNVQVQATVPMPNASCCRACSPMSAWIRARKKYLTLPQTAITYNPYGSTVFVLAPPPAKDALKDDKGQPTWWRSRCS